MELCAVVWCCGVVGTCGSVVLHGYCPGAAVAVSVGVVGYLLSVWLRGVVGLWFCVSTAWPVFVADWSCVVVCGSLCGSLGLVW